MLSYHTYLRGIMRGYGFPLGWQRTPNNLMAKNVELIVTQMPWSPIIWKGGKRAEANFVEAHYLALDFDAPQFTLDAAINEVFCDYKCIIGETRSHRKMKGGINCDRFRVVIPFDKPITNLRTYRYNMHRAFERFEYADKSCKDGARFYYPCTRRRFYEPHGDVWETERYTPDWFEKPTFDQTNFRQTLSPWARAMLTNVIPIGQRNTSCYRLGKDLCKAGFDFDAAVNLVVKSPTYQGAVDATLLREIQQSMRNGYKTVLIANEVKP